MPSFVLQSKDMNDLPLVSVGIPTFNRPEGIRNTLLNITNQTYKNIEVIVSDNCSPNHEVKSIVEEFCRKDSRVIYYRQEENIGIVNNFKFVLKESAGDYFMWAADDDEWHPDFINELISIIGNKSAAFSNYSIKVNGTNSVTEINLNKSASGSEKYEQAKNHLLERIPSMFYCIYKTQDISWFINYEKTYDWQDCFVQLKIILLFSGYAISERFLFTAGIADISYEYKPISINKKKLFTYFPYFRECTRVILRSPVTVIQKLKLIFYLFDVNFKSFIKLETMRKNFKFYSVVYRFYNLISPIKNVRRLY